MGCALSRAGILPDRPAVTLPDFMLGCGIQHYYKAEEGIIDAYNQGGTHWYIDGSDNGDRATTWDVSRIQNLRSLITDLGVQPIFHGNFKVPLASDVPEIATIAKQYVMREVDVSAALGAPLIVHGGGIVEPKKVKRAKAQALDHLIDNMSEVAAYAHEKGVDIWLENLANYQKFHPFYYIFTNYDEYESVLSRLDCENVYMMLDVCHEFVGGGDPNYVLTKFSTRIAALSLSDTDGTRDFHWPLGKGSVDFEEIVKNIKRLNWRGIVNFETRGANAEAGINHLSKIARALEMNPL